MAEPVKIQVPDILDHHVGRVIPASQFSPFTDYIIIEEDTFTYKASFLSNQRTQSYKRSNIQKLLVKILKYRKYITRKHKIQVNSRGGKFAELYLVEKDNSLRLLIPKVLIEIGEKRWGKFIAEIREKSGLLVEETGADIMLE